MKAISPHTYTYIRIYTSIYTTNTLVCVSSRFFIIISVHERFVMRNMCGSLFVFRHNTKYQRMLVSTGNVYKGDTRIVLLYSRGLQTIFNIRS